MLPICADKWTFQLENLQTKILFLMYGQVVPLLLDKWTFQLKNLQTQSCFQCMVKLFPCY